MMTRHIGRPGPGPRCHYPEGRIEFFNATIEQAVHGENYMRSIALCPTAAKKPIFVYISPEKSFCARPVGFGIVKARNPQ